MTGTRWATRGTATAALAVALVTMVSPGSAGAVPAAAAGTISTVAGGAGGPAPATDIIMSPCGVTFSGGSLYIVDGLDVRKVSPASDWLTTLAGTGSPGPASNGHLAARADLAGACSAAPDAAGNMVIADASHFQVRVVAASTGTFYGQAMTAGHIYAVAGDGTGGSAATAGRPPGPNWAPWRAWRSTAAATWSSPTPATTGSGWWPPPPARSTARR